ncbi:recombination associated protein RdgC [Paenalcaligenes hominis]|uniref:Recombination-associated protein RdgC n=1 Tax=Paenalcaligenes hominis TaxID=643674 RepID=A0ABX0WND1_9BURK|nr:recombination-associated protein RdgC [Paenalcaligenes hominis]NJB64294.1 recombination associated protein RdgC [Paenalcaligenes hominis]GGE68725.1 recombination-associated protein RdgC [Paenalcaligenes hominis]
MLFKNAKIFRLHPDFNYSVEQITEALERRPFTPCGTQEPVSNGWFFVDSQPLIGIDQQVLLQMRTEKKLLPSTVINQVARERAKDKEAEQGYKVGRKQMKELKEDLITELLPKAFSVHKDVYVWLDLENRWLVVDAASDTLGDEVMGLLAKTFAVFPAVPIYTEQSPASAMTGWLASYEVPYPFSIDQDAELKSHSENRATVKYANHNLDGDEPRQHIADGKQCTRLALTWADKISFVLTDGLEIKRINYTDLVKEQLETAQDEHDAFLAEFTLMAGEFNGLLNDLIEALGGEKHVI